MKNIVAVALIVVLVVSFLFSVTLASIKYHQHLRSFDVTTISSSYNLPVENSDVAQKIMECYYPTVRVTHNDSSGSGFLVRKGLRTLVVTAAHVLEAEVATVHLSHGVVRYTSPAKVVFRDADTDVAVLEIDVPAEPADIFNLRAFGKFCVKIESDLSSLRVFDEVMAIGHPLGSKEAIISTGEVCGKTAGGKLIISANVITGNSGGPVFNTNGKLIGMVHAVAYMDYYASGSRQRQYITHMTYVVPADMIQAALDTL